MKLNPVSTLVQGLQRNAAKVDKAVQDLQAAQVKGLNDVQRNAPQDVVAVGGDAAAVADANAAAVLAESGKGDMVKPLVDLLQAKTAYKANTAALRVTADVEQATLDIIGNRRDV